MTEIVWVANRNRVLPVVKYASPSKNELARRERERRRKQQENARKQRERVEFVFGALCKGAQHVSHVCQKLHDTIRQEYAKK